MPQACRLGDQCTGHPPYPPRPNIGASPNVFINKLGSHRVNDPWVIHCAGPVCHPGMTIAGSTSVFVNGIPAARVGDPIDCSSKIMTGSTDVFIG